MFPAPKTGGTFVSEERTLVPHQLRENHELIAYFRGCDVTQLKSHKALQVVLSTASDW
jgi:hypothetical protein